MGLSHFGSSCVVSCHFPARPPRALVGQLGVEERWKGTGGQSWSLLQGEALSNAAGPPMHCIAEVSATVSSELTSQPLFRLSPLLII